MGFIVNGLTHRGEGVVRQEGKAVFIPFAIPGEEVLIEVINEQKSYSRGRIKAIENPSPDRVNPPCRHFYHCGGCAYQHTTYKRQLLLKQQVVKEAMLRLGGQNIEVEEIMGMDDPWYYRNKVTWQVGEHQGEKRLGYYQLDSRRHLPISDCLIIAPEIKKFSQFLDCYLDVTGINAGRRVIIRQDSAEELFLIVEGPVDKAGLESLVKGYPGLKSLFIYQHHQLEQVFGSDRLQFTVGRRSYRVSPLAFFQINDQQTRVLYKEVKKVLEKQPGQRILDAYCGTGSIALYAAGENDSLLGVDQFAPAIEDAKINAALNHLAPCQFIAGACEKVLADLQQDFDTVILDPPRAGCHKSLLNSITAQNISQIIYVSCNPATLARDVRILCESSYKIDSVQPVDMFPWTSHVESVVLMSRVK